MNRMFLLQLLLLFVPTIGFSQTTNSDTSSVNQFEVYDYESMAIRPDTARDVFPEFWLQFREYVLDFDTLNLFERMEFPILVFGYLDDDPVYVVSKENILWFWNIFLFEDDNDNMEIIQSTIDVTKNPWYNSRENEHMVGYLGFTKYQEGWKLKDLYIDTRYLSEKAPCPPHSKDEMIHVNPYEN